MINLEVQQHSRFVIYVDAVNDFPRDYFLFEFTNDYTQQTNSVLGTVVRRNSNFVEFDIFVCAPGLDDKLNGVVDLQPTGNWDYRLYNITTQTLDNTGGLLADTGQMQLTSAIEDDDEFVFYVSDNEDNENNVAGDPPCYCFFSPGTYGAIPFWNGYEWIIEDPGILNLEGDLVVENLAGDGTRLVTVDEDGRFGSFDFPGDFIVGEGTPGFVPKFNGTNSITDSIIEEIAGQININGNLTADSFIKNGGTASQFLKADGSIDVTAYLAADEAASTYVPYTGANADVDLGANSINASKFNAGGLSTEFLKADGTIDSNTYLTTGSAGTTYVPYTGANADVTLGVHNVSANSFIKLGATSTNFLRAGGSDFDLFAANNTWTGSQTFTNSLTSWTGSFAPVGGSISNNRLLIGHTINQTGGATGITRGLYITPILTSAFDYRAIETTNNTGYAFYASGTAPSFFGGNLTALTLAKTGGTSSQFLKADGSVDSTAYTPTSRTVNINGVTFDLSADREYRTAQADTGCLTFGGISVVDGTHVTIGAATGYIVDNETNPAVPTYSYVNYAGEVNKVVTTVGSGIATYVLLNTAGTIVFQNTFPTSAQRKSMIYIAKIGHPAGTITTAGSEPDFITSPTAQFRDFFQTVNYVNQGVSASPIAASLTFSTSTGTVIGNGINFVVDKTSPNTITVSPTSPCSFLPRTQTGAGGGAITTVDVGNYDVAGTVTAIPGGPNVSTLRYIFLVPNLGYIVQYGQTTYTSLSNAVAAVGRESFTVYPSLIRNAILIGVMAATKSATNLNDSTQAQFFRADIFGQIIGASAGVSTGTMQSAYNNSLVPQVTVTDALGAMTWRNGRALNTSAVSQWQNIAGTGTAAINGNGSAAFGSTNTTNARLYAVGSGSTNASLAARIDNTIGDILFGVYDGGLVQVGNQFNVTFGGSNRMTMDGLRLNINNTSGTIDSTAHLTIRHDGNLNSGFHMSGSHLTGVSDITGISISNNYSRTNATGNAIALSLTSSFTDNSASALSFFRAVSLTHTINQTGATTGVSRGFYHSPTLTSAYNYVALTLGHSGTYTPNAGVLDYVWSSISGNMIFSANSQTITGLDISTAGTSGAGTTGNINNSLRVSTSFAASAGAGAYRGIFINPTINQTGTSTGVSYGLYGSATLTSAYNWRAFSFQSAAAYTPNAAITSYVYSEILPQINASVNNQVISALDISLTGSNGAFTGVARNAIRLSSNFEPTSGNGTHTGILVDGTINQTGGASGVTRGIYVNATLTSAAAWRSGEFINGSAGTFLIANVTGASAIGSFTVQGNSTGAAVNSAFTSSAGVVAFSIANDSTVKVGPTHSIYAGNTYGTPLITGTNLIFQLVNGGGMIVGSNYSGTSTGDLYSYSASVAYASPAAATATYAGYLFNTTIAQNATSTGITRTIYSNPVLTLAYNYRAFDFTSSAAYTPNAAITDYKFAQLTPNITASVNNQVISGMDITLSGSDGAFTGVQRAAMRLNGGNLYVGLTTSTNLARIVARGSGTSTLFTARFENSSAQNILSLRDDGATRYGSSLNSPVIGPGNGGSSHIITGTTLAFYRNDVVGVGVSFSFADSLTSLTSSSSLMSSLATLTLASGSNSYTWNELRGTINQTGTSTSTTYGYATNLTFTSVYNFRALNLAGTLTPNAAISDYVWSNIEPTINASINGQAIAGLQVTLAGSDGAFTGVKRHALRLTGGGLQINEVGAGLSFKEGGDAIMGTGTLSGGTVTINTNKVTASSRIFISPKSNVTSNGIVREDLAARSAGTSFTITSYMANSGSVDTNDNSDFDWFIIEAV